MNIVTYGRNFLRDEGGVTMVEYGLIAALIAIVALVALTGLGTGVQKTFTKVCEALSTALGGGLTCS